MPIVVQCSGCGGKFRAPDEAAGKRVKCPKCSSSIMLSSADHQDSAELPVAQKKLSQIPPPVPAEAAPISDQTRRPPRAPVWAWIGGAAITVLLVVVLLVFFLPTKPPAEIVHAAGRVANSSTVSTPGGRGPGAVTHTPAPPASATAMPPGPAPASAAPSWPSTTPMPPEERASHARDQRAARPSAVVESTPLGPMPPQIERQTVSMDGRHILVLTVRNGKTVELVDGKDGATYRRNHGIRLGTHQFKARGVPCYQGRKTARGLGRQ